MPPDSPAGERSAAPAKTAPKSPHRVSSIWLLHAGIIALVLAVLAVLTYRITEQPALLQDVVPETVYEINYTLIMDGLGRDIHTRTFLPEGTEHQRIDHLDVITGAMSYTQERTGQGLQGTWEAIAPSGLRKIGYRARISTEALRYQIAPDLRLSPNLDETTNRRYLNETSRIQVNDPILEDWLLRLTPEEPANVAQFLRTSFDTLTREIKKKDYQKPSGSAPALRLKEANIADQAYAFSAITRAYGLPSRVVRGFLLNTRELKTHYWNEILISDHWVPFCLNFGYFAEIPEHFLRMADVSSGEPAVSISGSIIAETRAARQFLAPTHESDNPEVTDTGKFNLINFLHGLGLDRQTSGLFLMFPLAALITAFFRNIIGFQTFGVFMPMLIAAACRYTGLWNGLAVFAIVIFLATLFHLILERLRMHNIAKMSAVITLITILMLGMLSWKELSLYTEISVLAVFPVVILSFTADRLSDLVQEREWDTLIKHSIATTALIILCYLVYDSPLMRGLFGTFPELIVLVFVLQVWVGCWVALRLSEYFRFRNLIHSKKDEINFDAEMSILGINMRNRKIVHTLNTKSTIKLANDKIASKKAFEANNVPSPQTLFTIKDFREIDEVEHFTKGLQSMVLKPANGSQGNGITLLVRREGDTFFEPSGQPWTMDDVANHMREITRGTFSKNGDADSVLVEALMTPSRIFESLILKGVPDIRVITLNQKPLAAMLRLPTKESRGKSNLHQGALGVDVDLETGICGRVQYKGKQVENHPDSGARVVGFQIPGWSRVLSVAIQAQRAVPLAYAGVDICIDEVDGPVVIEINARPGIEIQNIRQEGLQGVLANELQANPS